MRLGDTHRFIRWLWTSRRIDARLLRLVMLPLSALWWIAIRLRNLRFDSARSRPHPLPLPAVGVGNLSVGGSGKTPVAIWIAQHYAARGFIPGILTNPYGRDEALVHRRRVPTARVLVDRDRVLAARRAREQGAQVLVLDDAFQLRGIARDFNLAVVSAETAQAVRWLLPAGPWREGRGALSRADGLIVTRKRASREVAEDFRARLRCYLRPECPSGVLLLSVARYEGLQSGELVGSAALGGKRIVAASAIADPGSFIAQTKATGALVQVATWPDHHEFQDEDLAWLAKAARRADRVVITEKDAVKLRGRWPASVPEPLVAVLDLEWETGESELTAALDAVLS